MLVAGHLSQAEVDALLQSLRAGQTGADDPGAPPATGGGALAEMLARLLSAAWGRQVAELSLRPVAEVARGPVSHVARLGGPLRQRVWCWGEGRRHAALTDDFLQRLATVLALGQGAEALAPETPFPDDGVLMGFEGEGGGVVVSLTLGFEPTGPDLLTLRLAGMGSGSPSVGGASAVPLREIEVEATVYVGGGMYRLSQLANLRPGTILPLSTQVGEPAVIAIGDRVIAFGEIVVTPEETVAVRLTRVVLGDEGRAAAPTWLEQGPAPAERLGATPPPPERGRTPLA